MSTLLTGGTPAIVNAAILAATAGDVLVIPTGSYSWTTAVVLNKNITLQGQSMWSGGSGLPVVGGVQITNSVSGGDMLAIVTSPGPPHATIQNIAFLDAATDVNGYTLTTQGSGTPLLTGCYLRSSGGPDSVVLWRQNGGVIWNNTFYSNSGGTSGVDANLDPEVLGFYVQTNNPSPDWQSLSTMGMSDTNGDKNTYVENNMFNNVILQAFDISPNGRVVIRHNVFSNAGGSGHGQDTGPQGCRHWEFYNNTFIFCNAATQALSSTLNGTTTITVPSANGLGIGQNAAGTGIPSGTRIATILDGTHVILTNSATISGTSTVTFSGANPLDSAGGNTYPLNLNWWILVRGGTGVIFNNNFPNISSGNWGQKNAIILGDFNINQTPNAVPCQNVWPSAQQLGQTWVGNTTTTCTLNSSNVITNIPQVYNVLALDQGVSGSNIPAGTKVTALLSSSSVQISNAATFTGNSTVTFSGYSFPSTGTVGGQTTAQIDGTGFGREPVWFWGNTGTAVGTANYINIDTGFDSGAGCSPAQNTANFIQLNRDYIDKGAANTPKPGYTAYTYPHPLVTAFGGGGPPPPPTIHEQTATPSSNSLSSSSSRYVLRVLNTRLNRG